MNKLTLLGLSSETTSGHSVRYDVKISGVGFSPCVPYIGLVM